MKLKNFAVSALLLILITLSSSSQFYIKASGGYGLGLSTDFMYDKDLSGSSFDFVYGSFGEGIYPALGFGYMVNKNFGFEISGSYLLGNDFQHQDSSMNQFGNTYIETSKQKGLGIFISPSIVVAAPMKNITPYARFGATIGFPEITYEATGEGINAPTGTYQSKYSGNYAMGINGAGGVMFSASKRLNIFAELYAVNLTYKPEKWENTEAYTGYPKLPVRNISTSGSWSAENFPPFYLPLNNYGMNIGISYVFGKLPK